MNKTAKRFGKAAAGEVVSAKTGRDSSHGKAMATPAPRRTVRREMPPASFFVRLGILFAFLSCGICAALVHELWACDDGLDQRSEPIAFHRHTGYHTLNRGFIGKHQGPAQRVSQQFPAEIVDEVLLSMAAYVLLDGLKTSSLAPA